MNMSNLLPLGIYEHYKGKRYEVLGVGKHTETLDDVVIYRSLYASEEFGDFALWVRPLSMFLEYVILDENKVPRFRFLSSTTPNHENKNAEIS